MKVDGKHFRSIWRERDGWSVGAIDQRRLPHEFVIARLARDFPRQHEPCPIGSDRALDTALITAPEARDPALLQKLDAVAGRVLRP